MSFKHIRRIFPTIFVIALEAGMAVVVLGTSYAQEGEVRPAAKG